jgi:hypothetical protein
MASSVFNENQWSWLILSLIFAYWQPFAAKLHNFWDESLFPTPEKHTHNKNKQDVIMYADAYRTMVEYKQSKGWLFGWLFSAFHTTVMAFAVGSLVLLATEYPVMVSLHHEETFTLLMAFVFTSFILTKTIPVLLHWLLFAIYRWIALFIAFLIAATTITTLILLGAKDSTPKKGMVAGLWIPITIYTIILFCMMCWVLFKATHHRVVAAMHPQQGTTTATPVGPYY